MAAILLRLVLLAVGIGFGQMSLDSFARGTSAAAVQFGLSVLLLFAGSAGFIVPLLGGIATEDPDHV